MHRFAQNFKKKKVIVTCSANQQLLCYSKNRNKKCIGHVLGIYINVVPVICMDLSKRYVILGQSSK